MKTELRPRAREKDLIVQRSGEEILVYDISTGEAKCLSPSAAFVWGRCDGLKSAKEIAEEFEKELRSPVSVDFVQLAFDELARNGLVNIPADAAAYGVSRRQMIKKAGLTTMAALPVVASLIAPTAVSAQSCIPNNLTCTTSSQCCSSCCKNVGGGVNECKPGGGACLP
jgi:hypothetical protein